MADTKKTTKKQVHKQIVSLTREKESKVFDALKEEFGYKNKMEAPRLEKVIVSSGIGSVTDKGKIEIVQDRLAKITGQKAAPRAAKKSIASFKVREGDTVGYQVTLRGGRMHAFMDKLLTVSLPRTRDFRGLDRGSVDEMGNLTIGVKEHTVFPEASNEELKDVFGLSVTLVTSAKSREEAIRYFEEINIPFKKKEEVK